MLLTLSYKLYSPQYSLGMVVVQQRFILPECYWTREMFSYFMFKPPSSSPTNNRDKSSASSLRYNTSISQSRILLTTALSLSRYRLLLHAENSLKCKFTCTKYWKMLAIGLPVFISPSANKWSKVDNSHVKCRLLAREGRGAEFWANRHPILEFLMGYNCINNRLCLLGNLSVTHGWLMVLVILQFLPGVHTWVLLPPRLTDGS